MRRGSIVSAIGKAAKQLTPSAKKSKKKKNRRHRRSYSSSSASSSIDFESDSISSVSGSLSHASSLSASHSSCSETYEYSYDRSYEHRSHHGHNHNNRHRRHHNRRDNKRHHRHQNHNRRRRKRGYPRRNSHYDDHSVDDEDSDRMIDLLMRIIPFYGQGDKGSDNVVIDTIHRLPPQALETRDDDGNTLLMITCQAGAFGLLPILLSKGCDVNARNNVGASCLHYACFAETFSPNAAMTLVRHGAMAEVVEMEFGCTPLHWAAYHGHEELCRVLCRAGANPATIDKNGCDPISYSRESGKAVCTQLLESFRDGGGGGDVSNPASMSVKEDRLDWIRCMDGNMNSFYHNKETGESLWGDDFRNNIEEKKDGTDDNETKTEITPPPIQKKSKDLDVVETNTATEASPLPAVEEEERKQDDDGNGKDPVQSYSQSCKKNNSKRPTLMRLNSWDEELDEIKRKEELSKNKTTRALDSSSAASAADNAVSNTQFEDRLSVLHEKLNNRLESLEEKMVRQKQEDAQIKDDSAISALQGDLAAMTTATLDLKTQIGQKDLDILSLKQQIVVLETKISAKPRTFDVGVGVDTTSNEENDAALAADAEIKSQLANAQQELSKSQQEMSERSEELKATLSRCKETEKLLEIAENALRDEKASRESLMHLFEQAKEGHQVDSALTQSLEDEKQRAEMTINELRQQLQVLTTEHSAKDAAATDELLVQKAETKRLQNDIEQLAANHAVEIAKLKEQFRQEKEQSIDSLTQYHRAELKKVNDQLREETLSKMEIEASKYEAVSAMEMAQEKARSVTAKLNEMTDLIKTSKHLEKNNEELNLSLQKETERRKVLHNTIEDMKGRIRVYVRIRPLSESEIRSDYANVMIKEDDRTIAMAADAATGTEARAWEFDKIFCGTNEDGNTQEAIFQDTSLLITSAIDGFNVCIFAYGKLATRWNFFVPDFAHLIHLLVSYVELHLQVKRGLER